MNLLKSNNLRDIKYGNLLKRKVASLKTEIISSTIYKKPNFLRLYSEHLVYIPKYIFK